MIAYIRGFGPGMSAMSDTAVVYEAAPYPAQFWSELYGDAPHRAPNHYPPAPPKIQFKSTALVKPKITIKQPVSKAGFNKGQRR